MGSPYDLLLYSCYNDTNNNITIEIPNDSPKTIPTGAIYGYDWMISNAKVKIN